MKQDLVINEGMNSFENFDCNKSEGNIVDCSPENKERKLMNSRNEVRAAFEEIHAGQRFRSYIELDSYVLEEFELKIMTALEKHKK